MNLPNSIKSRIAIDPKLAVGSSLPKPKELIGLTILLYLLNNNEEYLDYSNDIGNNIELKDELIVLMKTFFNELDVYDENQFNSLKSDNALVTMQLEPLQVSLQIIWKLAKVKAINSSSSSLERTGGVRVPKSLNFTSNLLIIKSILTDDVNNISESSKLILYSWIFNLNIPESLKLLENKLKSILLIFTEDTLYKTWLDREKEVIFQQEGIYELINTDSDTVTLKGAKEIKGTLRNLKAMLSHNLHPYLKIIGDNVSLINNNLLDEFVNYKKLSSNLLDLSPKSISIINNALDSTSVLVDQSQDKGFNKIYFGPPGTGKSYAIKEELKKLGAKPDNYSRVTFHPDYDYHSFVGGYKPFTDIEDNNKIKYKFVPQVFTDLYVKASSNTNEDYYLVIEEINRGNCAEIFGDVFQLLDRNPEYNIEPSSELKAYLKERESKINEDITEDEAKVKLLFDGKLQMPNNLSILASMNTSDQSLYPMDSAFKRRWDWHYVPIDLKCNESNFTIKFDGNNQYSWLEFLSKVNDKIYSVTKSEDKQIGNWFINATKCENIISKELFINKVLFYLWNDVFKDEVFNPDNIFIEKNTDGSKKRDISFNNFYNKAEQGRLLIHLLSDILNVPLVKSGDKETLEYNQDSQVIHEAAEPTEEYKENKSESKE
ncbi:AAA family ATPase [Myroides odoratimimus]|uniref:McrB family protein n=1 Tax=Myroides odoratimimus TaxID=76832 RepID=UPI002DB57285|nr:AAA family ATPase [Myroides odoratimimus]MEC4052608.1 AAA family ATPase [Myroides odoratimimus]